ncbi:D-alanyl-D-alanine carboxypeptidase family protein [Lysinibacter cavernae]|uniref:D-alanyl-D-alanine carboxypeptidase (Penicillin-binding protein 5/6) n=1 Tax=Lysinibacter cavernae TaxID=1640652 RepID=A0A7X5QZK6_9MICO|nr:D-alanyl-D-alanine carboxypeptidase [Lysinibacter cavernae]NIH52797.1 D-alanyl-D-alanine carboxypeptidase (penicillin-binding protein 5/6) [Lysinibacter cavernae]
MTIDDSPPLVRPRKRIGRRRRLATTITVAALLLGAGGYTVASATAPLPEASAVVNTIGPSPIGAALSPAWPAADAVGAISLLDNSDVFMSSDAGGLHTIASITKVVTALMVLDAHPLSAGESGPTIPFTTQDQAATAQIIAVGGTTLDVPIGVALSERELISGMLVASANNYAEKLALWAYGDIDSYLSATRAWLDANGLTEMTIVDSNGLEDGNVAMVENLIQLGKLALANEVVADAVSHDVIELPSIGEVKNTNPLIGDDGFTGIKTGYTVAAGYCLLFAREMPVLDETGTAGEETATVIGVVLGADSVAERGELSRVLADSVLGTVHQESILEAGTQLGTLEAPWGDLTPLVAAEDVSVRVWGSATAEWTASPVTQTTPVVAGSAVGQLTVSFVDAETPTDASSQSVDIVTDTELTDPGLWWRLTHPSLMFG